jgi:hypothetical protein
MPSWRGQGQFYLCLNGTQACINREDKEDNKGRIFVLIFFIDLEKFIRIAQNLFERAGFL